LAARADRIAQRQQNFMKITRESHVGRAQLDILHQFDHVLWMGDFNYRVELPFETVVQHVGAQRFDALLAEDQFIKERAKTPCPVFDRFQEGRITWGPTYRFDKEKNVFSNKRAQAPSYTDRIVWRSLPGVANFVRQCSYSSVPTCFGSDHRPVCAHFLFVTMRPFTGLSPLSILQDVAPATLSSSESKDTHVTATTTTPTAAELKQQRKKQKKKNSIGKNRRTKREFVLYKMQLHSATLDKGKKFVITVDGEFVNEAVSSDTVAKSATADAWSWSRPLHLQPFVVDPTYLCTRHLLLTLRTSSTVTDTNKAGKKNDTYGFGGGGNDVKSPTSMSSAGNVGYAIVPLDRLVTSKSPVQFEAAVSYAGQHIATLKGIMSSRVSGLDTKSVLSEPGKAQLTF
jgi:hypothetical protein